MKQAAKRVVFATATVATAPLWIHVRLSRSMRDSDGAFPGHGQLLSLVPFRIGVYLRAAFYARTCAAVDREVTIEFLTLLSHADIDIGKHVYIGPQSNIGSCAIGRDCLLGSGVHVLSGKRQHNFSSDAVPVREQGGTLEKIRIGANCWIGNQATVMADVGANSIVAAGAVVVDPVPEGSIVGGNPGKVLKRR